MKNGLPLDFTDLIAPLAIEDFFHEVWEQRPLVQRCPAGEAFAELLSWEAAGQLLDGAALQPRTLRLFRDGAWLPETLYSVTRPPRTDDDEAATVADPGRVYEQFRRGAAIHVRDLHRSYPPIARFCRHLEEALGFPIGASAFLSPPNADPRRGEPRFVVHYDEQDQFVLQVSGSKRWRIYDAPYPVPLGHQSSAAMGVVPGECRQEVTLRAGDVIYLPRGYFHDVVTADEPSLHLVFMVVSYRWIDALRAGVEALSGDIRFRRSVPVRAVNGEGRAEFTAQFAAIKRLALDALSADAAAAELRQSFLRAHRPTLDGYFLDSMRADEVGPATALRRRPGVLAEESEDGKVMLRFGHKKTRVGRFDPASLRFIASRDRFRVADLPAPPDEARKVALARRLIREGVLELAERAADKDRAGGPLSRG